MDENWRDVPDTLFYQVSDAGRVRSVDRTVRHSDGKSSFRRGKVLTATVSKRTGYPMVYIVYANGARRNVTVHSLVAAAFIGPRPEGLQVCHKDGNRENPAADNLRYGTPRSNAADKIGHGTNNYRPRSTHCSRGHGMHGYNLQMSPSGRRRCRTCNSLLTLESQRRRNGFYDRNPNAPRLV